MARRHLLFILLIVVLVLTALLIFLYAKNFSDYTRARATAVHVKRFISEGDDIEKARVLLFQNGFEVSEIETLKGFGLKEFRVSLRELSLIDSFQYNTNVNLSPFSVESNMWLIVSADARSNKVNSLVLK